MRYPAHPPRIKELDEIKIGEFSMAHQLRAWKAGVYSSVSTASARGDSRAFKCATEAERTKPDARDFMRIENKKFQTLGMRFAAAIIKAAEGEL